MKTIYTILLINLIGFTSFSQAKLVNVKSKKYKTSEGIKIEGSEGFLEVSENRNDPSSRKIRLKYVHLKSLSSNPASPILYLEGGTGLSTWEASSPRDLNDRIQLINVADLIYLDRRGSGDDNLSYIWKEEYPADFFVSEEKANQHYQKLAELALKNFDEKGIDFFGYNIEEHAKDVNDLMSLLEIDKFTLFGFSYGTHIGMTVMELFPEIVERAILVGADAPNQGLNFPSHLDAHINKIGELIEKDGSLNMTQDDFKNLVNETMEKLKLNPLSVSVMNPLTKKKMNLDIGDFGLALTLRLEIDDANDIPIIPRLLYSIKNDEGSILTWFIQKRVGYALQLPGQGINQQLASGVSDERWVQIKNEVNKSIFGNAVNFPFSAAKAVWPETQLSFDSTLPVKTKIPTLFITGILDCRTPVEQVDNIMEGFANASHIKVENAGHEQAQWDIDVADKIIPAFIQGENIESGFESYSKINFIKLTGEVSGHPSIN